MIEATIKIDQTIDNLFAKEDQVEAKFDATPWFVAATDEEIADLVKIEFGGDYEADNVAWVIADTDPEVSRILEATQDTNTGFEVHIDADQAREWISANRPAVVLS